VQVVEAIHNIVLAHVDKAVLKVSLHNALQQARQGASKLFGFGSGKRHCLCIDIGEAVVDNSVGALLVLWDNAYGFGQNLPHKANLH